MSAIKCGRVEKEEDYHGGEPRQATELRADNGVGRLYASFGSGGFGSTTSH